MLYIAQLATGVRRELMVSGGDYPTPDGAGMRDYIHVEDLAQGHVAALGHLDGHAVREVLTLNLGKGKPYSVLQMIKAFETASGKVIPYQIVDRHAGDLAEFYADPSLAEKTLGWRAESGIDQMCVDAWRWQKNYVSE